MRPETVAISFICTFLVLIPLPCHWRVRNIPIVSLIFWFAAVNLPRGINGIIWAGNTRDYAPVWCDITTKLVMGANWAYCSSTVPVSRHLARVSSPYYRGENASERRRRMIFEIFMCMVLPLIGMALHYIVQSRRFDILEDFGCVATTYLSIASILIINLPPVIFALITLVYAAVALRWFIQRHSQFEAAMQSNNSGLTTSRYLRLVILSIVLMLGATAMSVFVLVDNAVGASIQPWNSWEYVHADWDYIDQVAKDLVPQSFWDRYLLIWYLVPIDSVIFFAFFGCIGEIKTEYLGYFNFVKTKVFRIKHESRPILPSTRDNTNSVDSSQVVVELRVETASQALYDLKPSRSSEV
ncbi:unnamed protein product [Rhizoctonia solani]|uniref:Pheromone B beta 1 receptor [Schizophyllum commune] n=1 Tax=Rhizoctonia solani TaxID=456999 RepID=A0A8H3B694_9AGAM|nr:unnamed protein product [Rhizoctonia solani]